MGSTTTTSTLTTITLHTQPKHQPTTINMSAPNVDAPNEGIVGQVTNSVKNAANYVSETIQGNAAEASKEANKEQAKGNVGDTTMSGRAWCSRCCVRQARPDQARECWQGQQGGYLSFSLFTHHLRR